MDILNFEDIITLIILCAIPLLLISSALHCKILLGIFICIIMISILVVLSSEALLDNAVPTENRTEIQEIIEQKSTTQNFNIRVTYKDLSGNTKEALVIDAKTSDDDISYSYIETKTYKYGFLYKDVNTLYLRRGF